MIRSSKTLIPAVANRSGILVRRPGSCRWLAAAAAMSVLAVTPASAQERVKVRPGQAPPRVERPSSIRPEAAGFEKLRQQALAARAPSGAVAVESGRLLRELEARYTIDVEAESARLPDLRPRPGGTIGEAGGAVSGDPHNAITEIHPCSKPDATLDVTGVQASPPLDPGEWILVQGCGLGSPGKLRLMGDFPGGHLELQIDHWGSTQVRARVPLVTGVKDMPQARLQLVRSDNTFSNLLDVGGFRATREVRRIHPTDVAIACGSGYGNQGCTFAQSHPLSETEFFGGATFAAKHGQQVTPSCESATYKLGMIEEGTDVASVSLSNGWVLAGYAWWWNPLAGSAFVLPPSGFNAEASSASVAMQWGTNVNKCMGPQSSLLRYRVDLYAVGPKGVPYK